jgi:osmotically-inducible protein OsmY
MNAPACEPLLSEISLSPYSPSLDNTAQARFRASAYLALRDVSCTISDGVACLQGDLPTYYLKQVAQEIAGSIDGVRLVMNRIEVSRSATRHRPGRELLRYDSA